MKLHKKPQILITGGAGYIGSHACIEFLNANYEVVVIDNLCNSSQESLNRVKKITNKSLTFIRGDIRNLGLLNRIFSDYSFDAVIHFAGLKAVGESVDKPIEYFDNNVSGTIYLLQAMQSHKVKKIVFSSSATVYGKPAKLPIEETFPRAVANPYGRTKLIIEDMLTDLCTSDSAWHAALLRYFNPVGAHNSGLIGEDPHDIPNNLLPYVSQVALGKLKKLSVFGNDYPTIDGTGVRDYIHVVDLAKAHVMALEYLGANNTGVHAWNLGVGKGYSVLQVIDTFEKANNVKVPYKLTARRQGDVAECYANPAKANKELKWHAKKTLHDMMVDSWRWQINNPNGYKHFK